MTLTVDQKRAIMALGKAGYLQAVADNLSWAIDKARAKYAEQINLPIFQGAGGWDDGLYVFTPILLAKGDEFDHDGRRWVMRWGRPEGNGLFRYEVDEVGVYEHEPVWHDTVHPGKQYCSVCGRYADPDGGPHVEFLPGAPKDFLDDNWYSREAR